MNKFKISAIFACAAALGIFPSLARAQAEAAAAAVAAPIVEKIVGAVTPEKKPEGSTWLQAEVVVATAQAITVREEANPRMIHTFTYGAELKPDMQNLQYHGGYQSGDKVKILYFPGKTEALRIHGKPSKPL